MLHIRYACSLVKFTASMSLMTLFCVFVCIEFFFFCFPDQCTVCVLILSNQINNWHLQVKNITKLPVLEIIFLYSQDTCPFKSYFWSDIWQTGLDKIFLTHNTLKKITQAVPRLVRCSIIVSVHNVKLTGHFQNLVRQCPMTECYFQHWTTLYWSKSVSHI